MKVTIDFKETKNAINCPICHTYPTLKISSMWGDNGHGYYDCYSYKIECPKCCLIESNGSTTVYDKSFENALINGIKSWNEACSNIKKVMGNNKI